MNKEEAKEALKSIDEAIEHHERMHGYFFWSPPTRAASRRSYERYHSMQIDVEVDGVMYTYSSNCSCSCKNIYFSDGFWVGGAHKDVRAFKKIKKVLEEIVAEDEAA